MHSKTRNGTWWWHWFIFVKIRKAFQRIVLWNINMCSTPYKVTNYDHWWLALQIPWIHQWLHSISSGIHFNYFNDCAAIALNISDEKYKGYRQKIRADEKLSNIFWKSKSERILSILWSFHYAFKGNNGSDFHLLIWISNIPRNDIAQDVSAEVMLLSWLKAILLKGIASTRNL